MSLPKGHAYTFYPKCDVVLVGMLPDPNGLESLTFSWRSALA